jgi:hypothetical protein
MAFPSWLFIDVDDSGWTSPGSPLRPFPRPLPSALQKFQDLWYGGFQHFAQHSHEQRKREPPRQGEGA